MKLNKIFFSFFTRLLYFSNLMYKIHFDSTMRKIERLKRKVNNYLFDHIGLRETLSFTKGFFIAAFTALFYAFAFYCFITPAVENHATIEGSSIITGGVGGITQVLYLIIKLAGGSIDPFLLQSICYFGFNIPILTFAFFKVGKKFAILSLINVGLSSLFIQLFGGNFFGLSFDFTLAKEVASALSNQHLTRVLFGGICVGLASAIAFKNEISCGGIDVFSYYFSLRKSTSVGKYATTINSTIIITFSILTIAINQGQNVHIGLLNFMYGIVYLFAVMLVVDFINNRNKKVQIQIITAVDGIEQVLIANFPHSTTTIKGKGGYSHADRNVVYMIVSSNEVKRVISLVKKIDHNSFISVTALVQVYGNFFIKPVE